MKKRVITFAILLFAAMQGAFAQITIFGGVVDAKDGSGIPGAYVTVKGTNITGVTNNSGNFALMNVPNDATLQVSYIGYKTVEIPIENQTRFNITLDQDAQVLGDVVVTAERTVDGFQPGKVEIMGVVRDIKTIPFAVTQMSGDELRRSGARSIAEGLWGRVPGLRTYMGRDGFIRIAYIRGSASFTAPRPPVYVVDGVPMGDPTDWLDMELIESVTILRRSVLYGSAGYNGVVIVTLKKY